MNTYTFVLCVAYLLAGIMLTFTTVKGSVFGIENSLGKKLLGTTLILGMCFYLGKWYLDPNTVKTITTNTDGKAIMYLPNEVK